MEKLDDLFVRYVKNQCTEDEIKLLLKYFKDVDNEAKLKHLILSVLQDEGTEEVKYEKSLDQRALRIYKKIQGKLDGEEKRPLHRGRWYISAAAAISLIVSLALYYDKSQMAKNKQVAKIERTEPMKQGQTKTVDDLAPGGPKAVLTLANGNTIVLDNVKNGLLARQGTTRISKAENGQITFRNTELAHNVRNVEWNSINIPKGGEYQIILSDGTKIWLNAMSSLKFPTFFTGKERKVELVGEAYFEVSKVADMPFVVISDNQRVEVLGTHFNISAYSDEATINTTLLEGSVRVSAVNSKASLILTPGQQTQLSDEINVYNVDPAQAIAWKDGLISFESADIQSIMRQISRWYNVEVTYSGALPARQFTGKISRETGLSQVLQVLEKSRIHFKVEGRKITVTP